MLPREWPGATVPTSPEVTEAPPRSARRRRVLAVAASLTALVAAVLGLSYRQAAVGPSEIAVHRPPQPAPATRAAAASLADVARGALSRVVTVESQAGDHEELGTGWLLDDRGDVVTNWHVITGNTIIRIRDRRDGSHVAVVLGFDREQDIAVLRSRDGLAGPPLPPGPSSDPPVPESTVVLASQRATGRADRTDATLVRLHEDVPVHGNSDINVGPGDLPTIYRDMLGLRARIFPGNSGGPVLDASGRVIGIVTLASKSQSQAFAIPIGRVIGELRAFAARATAG